MVIYSHLASKFGHTVHWGVVNSGIWLLSSSVSLTCGLVTPELLYPPYTSSPAPHQQHYAAPSSLPPFISHRPPQPIWPRAARPRAVLRSRPCRRLASPLFACLGFAHGTVKPKPHTHMTVSVRGRYLLSFCISPCFPVGLLAMWRWYMFRYGDFD